MKVRVLSAIICAMTIPVFATAAQARVETPTLQLAAYGKAPAVKPGEAKNTKSNGLVFALATTSDVAIGATAKAGKSYSKRSATKTYKKKSYASNKAGSKKKYARGTYKRKSYASSSRGKSRLASRAMTAGRGDGGSSRSCLQSSARALLNRIESRFGPVNIVSTCRAGAVIATSGKPSKHRYGLAIDFSAPGRKAAVVQWLLANHHSGGTMTYRDMDHIHVDVGYRFVSLGANSGRG